MTSAGETPRADSGSRMAAREGTIPGSTIAITSLVAEATHGPCHSIMGVSLEQHIDSWPSGLLDLDGRIRPASKIDTASSRGRLLLGRDVTSHSPAINRRSGLTRLLLDHPLDIKDYPHDHQRTATTSSKRFDEIAGGAADRHRNLRRRIRRPASGTTSNTASPIADLPFYLSLAEQADGPDPRRCLRNWPDLASPGPRWLRRHRR